MRAYDASCRSKCHAAWMRRAAQPSGVALLVGMGVQRTAQKKVKSKAKYLAFEEPPIHAFYF